MEIIKKNITIDRKMGKENSQILIEGDIIVPDIKPDINIVLETNATAYIDNKEIINERISFKGNMDINVLFISKGESKEIQSMSSTYPINDFINMENLDKSMTVFTSLSISNLDYKLINDRKVSFRVLIDVVAEVLAKNDIEIVSNIEGLDERQLKLTRANVNKLVCSKFDRFNIKDEAEISTVKPNIKEILNMNLSIMNKDVKVFSNKVTITGDIKMCVLYKGEEEGEIVTYFEQEIPFNGSIEVDGADEGMIADVKLEIQDSNTSISQNADGEDRIVALDTHIGCNIKVNCEQEMTVLEDAYALDKELVIQKSIQIYPQFVCKNKNQATIKDVIKLENDCPEVLQVLKVTGNTIIDNIQIMDNKVIVDGIIECKLLYIANDDNYPLYFTNAIIPYSQAIDAKGTKADISIVDINATLETISVNIVSDKDVEFRVIANFDTTITNENEISFITEVETYDIDRERLDKIASMTVYILEEKDTLWNLAKKFNTLVPDIMELNEIEDEINLKIGQKLLILKNII